MVFARLRLAARNLRARGALLRAQLLLLRAHDRVETVDWAGAGAGQALVAVVAARSGHAGAQVLDEPRVGDERARARHRVRAARRERGLDRGARVEAADADHGNAE